MQQTLQSRQNQLTHVDGRLHTVELGSGFNKPALCLAQRQIDAVLANVFWIGVHVSISLKIGGDGWQHASTLQVRKKKHTAHAQQIISTGVNASAGQVEMAVWCECVHCSVSSPNAIRAHLSKGQDLEQGAFDIAFSGRPVVFVYIVAKMADGGLQHGDGFSGSLAIQQTNAGFSTTEHLFKGCEFGRAAAKNAPENFTVVGSDIQSRVSGAADCISAAAHVVGLVKLQNQPGNRVNQFYVVAHSSSAFLVSNSARQLDAVSACGFEGEFGPDQVPVSRAKFLACYQEARLTLNGHAQSWAWVAVIKSSGKLRKIHSTDAASRCKFHGFATWQRVEIGSEFHVVMRFAFLLLNHNA